jgi:hypothetical protein
VFFLWLLLERLSRSQVQKSEVGMKRGTASNASEDKILVSTGITRKATLIIGHGASSLVEGTSPTVEVNYAAKNKRPSQGPLKK